MALILKHQTHEQFIARFRDAYRASAAPVTVNVINNAEGTQARQQTRQDAGGKTIVDVVVETVRAGLINDIGKGGALAGALEGQYGLNRAAGAWR